jgi:hypothetical protein
VHLHERALNEPPNGHLAAQVGEGTLWDKVVGASTGQAQRVDYESGSVVVCSYDR